MVLARWDPWDDLRGLESGIARLWARSPGVANSRGGREYPPLNVSVGEDEIVVSVELPGVKLDDVEITLTGDTLVIAGEKKPGGEGKAHRRERFAGRFSRTIHVPKRVARDAIQAKLLDGILTITLPEAAQAKRRKITVTPAAEGGA